jgi:hypothetical protein
MSLPIGMSGATNWTGSGLLVRSVHPHQLLTRPSITAVWIAWRQRWQVCAPGESVRQCRTRSAIARSPDLVRRDLTASNVAQMARALTLTMVRIGMAVIFTQRHRFKRHGALTEIREGPHRGHHHQSWTKFALSQFMTPFDPVQE